GMRKDVTMEHPPTYAPPGRQIVLHLAIVQGDPEREGVIPRNIHDIPKLMTEPVGPSGCSCSWGQFDRLHRKSVQMKWMVRPRRIGHCQLQRLAEVCMAG